VTSGLADIACEPKAFEVGSLMLMMSDAEARSELVGYLVTTAKAHHKATGGVNPQWAECYTEHLITDVNRVLNADMSVDELAESAHRGRPPIPRRRSRTVMAEGVRLLAA
jgi:hypothetical protein